MGGFLQDVLSRLAALAMAASAGLMDPGPTLLDIPADVVSAAVDDLDERRSKETERARILELLSRDPRVAVRCQVAESVGALPPPLHLELTSILRALARDPSLRVRIAAADALAAIVQRASLGERSELVSRWALSVEHHERAAIARALRFSTPVLVGDLAIELLGRDPDAEVRAAALEAAHLHFRDNAPVYLNLALSRVSDPHPRVRALARRIVSFGAESQALNIGGVRRSWK